MYVTFFVPHVGNGEFLLSIYPKNKFCVWQSVAKQQKFWVNLKSVILKCNTVIPRAVIGEPLTVFNIVAVG